ncbi:hypothetical protein B0I37DRAFT_442755 [Chaetomium sp. MPI-CAGE-AT-0009]|nr:hypothetical protein B0I37DRAFT_442755 [Chaetomium sp. MPI-CAGE-AT-0009]
MSEQIKGAPPTPSSGSTSLTTFSGSTAARRARRAEASDSSESSLGVFDVSNVKFRVVTPPRPLPLISCSGDESRLIDRHFGDEFPRKAEEIATECGIPKSTVSAILTARVFRDDPSDSQPAILIVVDEWTTNSPPVWQAVVEKVKKYIDMRVTDSQSIGPIDISVEMVSTDLVNEKYISPLDDDEDYPPVKAAWPKIKNGIYDILEKFTSTAGHMTAISLFKLGFDEYYNNTKTVYVTVDYGSPENGWPPVVESMQKFVDGFGFDLHVHLEHNLMGHSTFLTVPLNLTDAEREIRKRDFNYDHTRPYTTAVSSGADIGAGCYIRRADGKDASPMVGTLGCWVEINVKDRGWSKMALTNYHIVRPSIRGYTMNVKMVRVDVGKPLVDRGDMGDPQKDSDLRVADREGLATKDRSRRHRMEHPARIKHIFTVETVQRRIRSLEQAGRPVLSEREELNSIISFFDQDKQYFGEVCFGSGYLNRTKTNGRLDWALIKPISDDRIGGNALPSKQDWATKEYLDHEFPFELEGNLRPQTRSIHGLRKGDRVFKKGASTKCTVGKFEEIKADCNIREENYMLGRSGKDRKSTEYMFFPLGSDTPFGNRGDSGSVVWDENGGVMGLLFTGQQPQGSKQGYCLVTPIEDVFDSIKEMSEGKILDIRILEESKP